MSDLLICGGRLIDPVGGRDLVADVRISDGTIAEIGENLSAPDRIDAAGCWVTPGLIDLHTHLREPGGEAKETIRDGARAAAAGGFAQVLAMPNTSPAIDTGYLVKHVMREGAEAAGARVLVSAALTAGRAGAAPANLSGLKRAGAIAFTDDGDEPADSRVMLACMTEAARLGVPVLVHAEDPWLVEGGSMNEGALSTVLGLQGRPALAETLAVSRDIMLARHAGCRLHIQHVSVAAAIALITEARRDGVQVTCEATPHHLVLNENACAHYDPSTKVNPPLRSEEDRRALIQALAEGPIDTIATDHAPHTVEEKSREFAAAPSGMVGLETAVGLMLTEFVAAGTITPARFVELMSSTPARILGLSRSGTLEPGSRADVTIIDPAHEWVVDPTKFVSRGRNTPFAGRALRGRAVATIVGGRVVHSMI